jgi:hypothetical protein
MEKIIAQILTDIETYLDEGGYDCLSGEFLDTLCGNYHEEILINYGATRWCILFKKYDYVLKMPRFESTDTDYCAIELANYHQACKMGIEQILLPIEKIAVLGKSKYPIYKQPKYSYSWRGADRNLLQKLNDDTRRIYPEDSKSYNILCHAKRHLYDSQVSIYFLSRVMQLYGKKFLKRFCRWTRKQKVNDLHRDNYGFRNNKPVLIDYAGFYD